MTMQTNIASALLRLVTAANNLKGMIGTLSSLTTTDKTSLVAALNEVKASIPGAAATIDDLSTSGSSTWSSTKISTHVTAAISALINGAPGAQDTLAELAAQISALVSADTGLLSFAGAQSLTAPQMAQAGANLGIGDPAWNYVTAIEAALNAGL